MSSGAFAALALGLLLGLKHATDADHVVAVSTIVSQTRNAWKSIWIGGSWGLGHTAPLIVLGVIILLLKESVLDRYEAVAPVFEFGVGIMLVLLGIQVFLNLRKGRLHMHEHEHDESHHVHVHSTHGEAAPPHVEERHGIFQLTGRPTFRMKSFVVGIVHGLAGSAAVMLALLPEVSSFAVGVGYLVLFGVGTVLSMSIITIVLAVPFALTGAFNKVNRAISGVSAAASVAFGIALMLEISTGATIIPF
ncbi:MAG: hypothetical protein FJ319_14415 [SAR202 cluster bacterium]|nr:hypothetical protein [SAR202 cluster bacterium]